MSWRDNLFKASFKGIPFKLDTSDRAGGRRVEVKTFAGSNEAIIDDFGKAPIVFTLTGYIIANAENNFDYFENRDNLIDALDAIDPGILVHPYYGALTVYVTEQPTITESSQEGGICKFTVGFTQIGIADQDLLLPGSKKQSPNITLDSVPSDVGDFNALIDDSITAADYDVGDNFTEGFNRARSFAGKLKDSITDSLRVVQDAIFKVRGGISTLTAQVTGAISTTLVILDNIIDSPCDIGNSIKNAARSFSAVCGVGSAGVFGGVVGGCSGILRGEVTELDGVTIPETLGKSCITEGLTAVENIGTTNIGYIPLSQINNATKIVDISKYGILSSIMQVAIRTEFLNQSDLIKYADLIADAVESLLIKMGAETDESTYSYAEGEFIDNTMMHTALADLNKIFVQAMYAKASTIAKKKEYYVPAGIMSTLQIAYDKYEDLERSEEVYNMNLLEIRHPGFLPNGEVIEVLDE